MPFIPEDERQSSAVPPQFTGKGKQNNQCSCLRLSPDLAVTGNPVPFYSLLISSAVFPGDIQRGHPAGALSRRPLLLLQPAWRLLLPELTFTDYTDLGGQSQAGRFNIFSRNMVRERKRSEILHIDNSIWKDNWNIME